MQIEIDMRDVHRSLGAGRRIVEYVGFSKGRLLCRDSMGNHVRVPRKLFRFEGVLGHETRVTDGGHVEVKVDEEWQSLGPLFGDAKVTRR